MSDKLIKGILPPTVYEPFVIGTSDISGLIPVYSLFQHSGGVSIVDSTIVYKKPKLANSHTNKTASKAFSESLLFYYSSMCRHILTRNSQEYTIYIGGGLILEDITKDFLFLLCYTGGEDIMKYSPYLDNYEINPDFADIINTGENLHAFVATEFYSDDKYKNVFRTFTKEYLNLLLELGIEVSILPAEKITKKVFKNCFNPTFNSLDELEESSNPIELVEFIFPTVSSGEFVHQPEETEIPF